jgi:hypothetical protein
MAQYHTEATKTIAIKDKDILDGLTKGASCSLAHSSEEKTKVVIRLKTRLRRQLASSWTLPQALDCLSNISGTAEATVRCRRSRLWSSASLTRPPIDIDVGASQMIADGKIKIKQGKEVTKLTKDGILFEDGVELKADIIVRALPPSIPTPGRELTNPLSFRQVLATGYTSQRETIRRVISNDVADRIGPCWGKDAQGEIVSPARRDRGSMPS